MQVFAARGPAERRKLPCSPRRGFQSAGPVESPTPVTSQRASSTSVRARACWSVRDLALTIARGGAVVASFGTKQRRGRTGR